ncbi:DUF6906 family protein [Jeotgalibacillus salarius]|uniref:DUF6906 domain-containing protein n=1 Tax=Jeotgalibacillus salarius TaxID=546023 RepID=A0A4Y8LKC0_9BACL|nr:hypothetical protein [Jeotgalibacillus salarius]TFE02859.1 hypothetical protein E2626_03365 [Jeotgalibacillus salarius]
MTDDFIHKVTMAAEHIAMTSKRYPMLNKLIGGGLMKHGKKPTVAQRKLIKACNLNSDNWLVSKVVDDMLVLVHRYTGTVRKIPGV